MKANIFAAVLMGGLFLLGQPAVALQELSDQELDGIAAGGVSAEVVDGLVRFQFGDPRGRFSLDGNAEIRASEGRSPQSVSSLIIRDQAQRNLKAFVNVNAVDSLVNVLINLNVNINSSVGVLTQGNGIRGN